MSPSPHDLDVVIAGAGFGGLKAAELLQGHANVTLVSPDDRFTFKPLTHELVSEESTPRRITRPVEDKLTGEHVVARAVQVKDGHLTTGAGEEVAFDKLIVAIGAEPNYFGVPGAREHALPFWSLRDGLRGNSRLKELLVEGPAHGDRFHVNVVGAGLTGLEVATEVAAFFERYQAPYQVNVPELREELFPHMEEGFARATEKGLERYHVNVLLGAQVQEIRPDGVDVQLAGDEVVLPSDLTFWCAGIQGRTLDPLSMEVRPTLRSVDDEDVYIVGDCARFRREDYDAPVPQLAQTAEQGAEVAVHNILTPHREKRFDPKVKGTILSLGPGYAVAQLRTGHVMSGRLPWHVKKQLYKWHLSS